LLPTIFVTIWSLISLLVLLPHFSSSRNTNLWGCLCVNRLIIWSLLCKGRGNMVISKVSLVGNMVPFNCYNSQILCYGSHIFWYKIGVLTQDQGGSCLHPYLWQFGNVWHARWVSSCSP
jgi:hypothetical protein